MKREIRVTIAAVGLAGASLTLGSCGLVTKLVGVGGPPPRQAAAARPAPKPEALAPAAAAAAPARASEAVWGLRSGLNVAALSCRGHGRQPVAGAYARMLARHRGLLAAAYRREQDRQGTGAFDRQQTRVYNAFANQPSPARFCTTASAVAQRANGLDSNQFALAAPRMLGELRASLRR